MADSLILTANNS